MKRGKRPITVNGKPYDSILSASKILSIAPHILRYQLSKAESSDITLNLRETQVNHLLLNRAICDSDKHHLSSIYALIERFEEMTPVARMRAINSIDDLQSQIINADVLKLSLNLQDPLMNKPSSEHLNRLLAQEAIKLVGILDCLDKDYEKGDTASVDRLEDNFRYTLLEITKLKERRELVA